jgi:hypothetical protein
MGSARDAANRCFGSCPSDATDRVPGSRGGSRCPGPVGRTQHPVHSRNAEEGRDGGNVPDPPGEPIDVDGDSRALEAERATRIEPELGLELGDRNAHRPAPVAEPGLSGVVVHPRAAETPGQPLGAITEDVGRAERSTGPRPRAVVAGFDPRVALEEIEPTPAVGQEVVLELDVQDPVPLGEVEVVARVEVSRDRPELDLAEAVNL